MAQLQEKALKEAENLKNILTNKGYSATEISAKQYNYEFDVLKENSKFKVLVYFGKKGIKKIVQGNKDNPGYENIRRIVEETLNLFPTETPVDEPDEYIGTDESGKGDIFGPLVVAAVYVNERTKSELKRIGVKDSKMLSRNEILTLAKKIEKIIDNNFIITELLPDKYNKLYEEFGNLNKLLGYVHSETIEHLLQKVNCNTVIIDKFGPQDLEIEGNFNFRNVQFLKYSKGERYTAVAAASILARARMEEWFEKNKINGKNIPKGASLEAERFLKELLKNTDKKKLTNYIKLHFKSIKKFSN